MVPPLVVPPPRPTAHEGSASLRLSHLLPRPVWFAMAGGGAHGAVQWGSLQALSETDIVPDGVIGTSVGALGGALLAEDPVSAVNRLAYVWAQLDMSSLLGERWFGKRWFTAAMRQSLVDSAPERAALEQMLVARHFDDLVVPFSAVTTDIATGRAVVHDSGDLIAALLASSAIPGLMPPVVIDGRPQMDGLASANLPAGLAVARGARTVIVLDTGSRSDPDPEEIATSQARIVSRAFAVMAVQQRRAQIHAAARRAVVVVLPTPDDLGGSLDFRDTMDTAARSFQAARRFLLELSRAPDELGVGLHARRQDPVAEKLGDVRLWAVGR